MTDCPNGEIRDLLPEYVHGSLDGAVRASVEAHLAGCGDCRAEVDLLRSLRRELDRVPTIDVARIAAALPKSRERARGRVPLVVAARGWRQAAAVAAIALGGLSYAVVRQRDSTAGRPVGPSSTATVIASDSPVTARAATSVAVSSAADTHHVASASVGGELSAPSVAGLSDDDLDLLLKDMERFDVVPDAEPASVTPVLGQEGE